MENYNFNDIEPVHRDRDINYDSYYKYITMIYELDRPILTIEQEMELFERIYAGDQDARNILVESNLRLVIDIAKQLSNNVSELVDNIQNGNIGLIKAIDKYNPNKGTKFSSYAYYWIKREIIYVGYKEKKNITLPFDFKDKYRRYSKAKIELQYRLKRNPTIEEIALFLGEDEEYIFNIKKYLEYCDVYSLDCVSGEDDEYVLYDFVADDKIESVESIIMNDSLGNEIENSLKKAKLKDEEIEVLKYRNGYYNNRVYSLQKIGEIFGVSRERVRQIEAKALSKLRDNRSSLISLGNYLYESDKKIEDMADKLLKENNDIKVKYREKERIKNAKYRAKNLK